MPKRSSKGSNPEDVNETAFRVLREATGEKNPAAVALGRLGGKKGGPARAAMLSPKKRQQIARAAAMKRWHPPEA
jgi:non-homologous end joining protein Ku